MERLQSPALVFLTDTSASASILSRLGREAADLIETQAREIERLREALRNIMALEDDFESNAAMTAHEWQMFRAARAALAGDSLHNSTGEQDND